MSHARAGLLAMLGVATLVVGSAEGCGETVLVLVDAPSPSDAGGDAPFGFPEGGVGDGGPCSERPSETDEPCRADAAIPGSDAGGPLDASCESLCPAAGGSCMGGACHIACTHCTGTVCPPGIPCEVTCNGANSCVDLDCGRASSCRVICRGGSNCVGVRCVSPSCTVHCEDPNACTGTIYLGGGTTKLECAGANACAAAVTCCSSSCEFMCPGATNCGSGLCCGSAATKCKSDKPTTTCSPVACSGE